MTDLIWIGNTLYPRWVVFVCPVAMIALPYFIAAAVSTFRKRTDGQSALAD